MAGDLQAAEELRSDRWKRVFRSTYRHLFVPRFYVRDGTDPMVGWCLRWRLVDGRDPGQRTAWLDAVYSNQTLITSLMNMPIPPELGGGTVQVLTSSSTLPGLVLRMLETLDVHDGHRVLEIGTGTGYNAALLCGLVGSTNVMTVDIDPELTDAAVGRLAAHGYRPTVVAGDGEQGLADHAPYDRIISTTSVDRVPSAWLRQARPGALILLNLRLPLMLGALVLLRVEHPNYATGWFQPGYASFMGLRHRPDEGYVTNPGPRPSGGREWEGTTTLDPRTLHTDDAWPFFASLVLRANVTTCRATDDAIGTRLVDVDGSWAIGWHANASGVFDIVQGGPRRLWDELEAAHDQWRTLGKPSWDQFMMTMTPEQQYISLPGHPQARFVIP